MSWEYVSTEFNCRRISVIVHRSASDKLAFDSLVCIGKLAVCGLSLNIPRKRFESFPNKDARVLRLKLEVQILGSLKSIRHTKVKIFRLKSCFLRKKETKFNANL